jgi:hypothetical protein
LPSVRIQPRAEFLHAVGPEETVRHFADLVRPFIEGLVLSVARLDLFVDAVYASAPASIDLAAADVIGARFFGERSKRASGTKSPRHFRANPSEGSGAPESRGPEQDF